MKTRVLLVLPVLLSLVILSALFGLAASSRQAVAQQLSAPHALSVTAVSPTTTANDLDTALVITGTGFVNGATAKVGETALVDVTWVSSTRLEGTLPWGMEPGVYTLEVTNPGGGSASLPDALAVTQGIGAWTHATGPEGGAVQLVEINSLAPDRVYMVPQDGGVFRSLDGGVNWELSLDKLQNDPYLAFGADGHTVYGSTGGRAVDVWRSDDDGATWNPIPIPGTDGGYKVFAHPTDSQVVFAMITEYCYGCEGLYRSDDRGQNWITVTEGISGVIPAALAIDAMHPLTMALGTVTGDIYLSTDGGNSWSYAAQAIPGRIGWMSFHPSGNGELWVNSYHSCDGAAKSTSPDLSTWTEVLDNGYKICTNRIHLAPLAWGEAYSQTVFAATFNIRISSDGGLTWNDYGGWPGDTAPVLALHPTDPQTIYVGSTLGMYVTTDGGTSWQALSHGLTGIAPEALAIPGAPDTVYAQDEAELGIFLLEQGGAEWSFLPVTPTITTPMNRTTAFTIDPNDPQRMYLAGYETIMISTDGGHTWPYTTTLPTPAEYASCEHYTTRLAADPFSPGVILAGVHEACGNWGNDPGSLYLSTDYGETWIQRMVGESIGQVNDIAFDWGSQGTVYAAAAGNGVLRSRNSGLTWEEANNGLDGVWGQIIETETTPPYRIYYGSGGFAAVSEDQGDTWSGISTPRGGGFGIQLLHSALGEPSVLYLANGTGLYFSLDGGSTWKRTAAPLGTGVVWTLSSTNPDERTVLYAGAAGGVYRLTTVPVQLSGTVTDNETGQPIEGAQVQTDAGLSAITDSSGYYSFTLPTGVYALTVGAEGYYTQTLDSIELVMGPVVQDIALIPARVELSGQVSDAYYGTPIEGAELVLNTGESTLTDPTGVYTFSLATGVYTLTAQADGYISRTIGGIELISGTVVQNFLLIPPAALPEWAQVNADGFGSPDYQISVLEVFQPEGSPPYLYAGLWGVDDTKVWRTSDGWNWEVAGPEWVTPTINAFDAQVFDGQLYFGLGSPAQLWRTDGETWQAIDTVGFGDTNNVALLALAVFEDHLYAAMQNDVTGIELWRSSSGDPGTWVQVNQDGFGGPGTNGDVTMDIFQDYMYVGLTRDGLGELWRTDDGTTWEPVFTDGLGNGGNGRMSMAEFNGEFYLGVRNVWQGGQIWKSSDGLDWELVMEGGFGDVNNGRPYGMLVADGALYVVFGNPVTGAQVWRTFDGDFWQRCNLDGWGDPLNAMADYNDKAAAVFNFNLYVGTLNNPNGGEIWRLLLATEQFLPMVQK